MGTGLIAVSGSGVQLPNLGDGAGIVPGSPTGLSAVYLYANLPSAGSSPVGTILYTSDQGPVYSNGITWVVFGSSGGGGAPVFNSAITATAAASQNNWQPAGWVPGANAIYVTTNASGSTLTGLFSTGFTNNTAIFIAVTPTSTGNLIMPALSGSSSVGNQFTAGVGLTPGTGGLFVLSTGVGWYPA